jgi:hypothetical protein
MTEENIKLIREALFIISEALDEIASGNEYMVQYKVRNLQSIIDNIQPKELTNGN